MALFHSIWTIVVMVIFIGIVIWAWSGKRQSRFEEAARLPLQDDLPANHKSSKTE